MKVGDRVYDEARGKTGVVTSDAIYRTPQRAHNETGVLVLFRLVEFDEYTELWCEAQDLKLEDTPQVSQFMRVQISFHAENYWGMTGTIIEHDYRSALVRIDGYSKPLWFELNDIEPLSSGADLECWLDSLLPVKEY